jgi:hypothetical protein
MIIFLPKMSNASMIESVFVAVDTA